MKQQNKKIKFYNLDEKPVSLNLNDKVKIIKGVVTIYFK
jgi:hypothetical protein